MSLYKVGDRVKVIAEYPKYGWGMVSRFDEGEVVAISVNTAGKVFLNFPVQTMWAADIGDLILVGHSEPDVYEEDII